MNPQSPDISIIIPTYNEEKYLDQCLSSVFQQQTTCRYEVIVADNLSTDATTSIIEKYHLSPLIVSQPGPAAVRNAGAAQASASLLYFVDADCRLPPGQLEKIWSKVHSQPETDVLAGPYVYDQDGLLPLFFTQSLKYFSLYHFLIKKIFQISQFPGGNFVIKKDLFLRVNGFDQTINNQQIVMPDDLDLALRLNALGSIKFDFNHQYFVYSSFRRVKQSPLHSLVRAVAALSLLLRPPKSSN